MTMTLNFKHGTVVLKQELKTVTEHVMLNVTQAEEEMKLFYQN
jgi:hypothetical protein